MTHIPLVVHFVGVLPQALTIKYHTPLLRDYNTVELLYWLSLLVVPPVPAAMHNPRSMWSPFV